MAPITDATIDLLGKDCDDLQQDIEIADGEVSGTLKAVTGYTGFSGDVSEQSGNYLAIKAVANVEGATIQATLTKPVGQRTVTLDSDGILIARITDKSTQKIIFVASKDGYNTFTSEYSLSDLTVL